MAHHHMLTEADRAHFYELAGLQRISAVNSSTNKVFDVFTFEESSEELLSALATNLISPAPTSPPTPPRTHLNLEIISNHFKYKISPSPSPPQIPSTSQNILIFLHGAGETTPDNNFYKLGVKMNLPNTTILSLLAPHHLPFELGQAWYHEMDYTTGDQLPNSSSVKISSLKASIAAIHTFITDVLKPSYSSENMFLFGFSSGATVAMEVAKTISPRLGGCICVCGGCLLIENASKSKSEKSKTPVLQFVGGRDAHFRKTVEAKKSQQLYNGESGKKESFKLRLMEGKGHEMVGAESEMKELFVFMGKNLANSTEKMESMFSKVN